MSAAKAMSAMDAMDVRAALKEGIALLCGAQVPSSTLAAEVLLMHVLAHDRTWLYTHPESQVSSELANQYLSLLRRRAAGEPVQYLIGTQEFWGLGFEVTPDVLIPRPETEHLVEVALERLQQICAASRGSRIRIADVGTGSGCIAVALARELPRAEILATDISKAILKVARRNAARHGVSDRIHFLHADLLQPCAAALPEANGAPAAFDLIVSNPPYLAREEAAALPREVRDHEPEVALFGGPSGIEIYGRLAREAGSLLRPGGILVFELGYGAAERISAILAAENRWVNIAIANDLAGIPRVIAAERI